MDIRTMVIGVIIMSGMIAGTTGFYLDIADRQNLNVTDELGTFQRLEEINDMSKGIKDTIFEGLEGIPILSQLAALTLTGIATFNYIFTLPTMFTGMGVLLVEQGHLPYWIPNMINAIILMLIIFIMLSAFLKWRI